MFRSQFNKHIKIVLQRCLMLLFFTQNRQCDSVGLRVDGLDSTEDNCKSQGRGQIVAPAQKKNLVGLRPFFQTITFAVDVLNFGEKNGSPQKNCGTPDYARLTQANYVHVCTTVQHRLCQISKKKVSILKRKGSMKKLQKERWLPPLINGETKPRCQSCL